VTKTGVVLGVSGQIGAAVARRMLAEGWSVRGLHQPDVPLPDDLAAVEVVIGDRNDDGLLARVLGGGADGVVDTIAYKSAHAHHWSRTREMSVLWLSCPLSRSTPTTAVTLWTARSRYFPC
jgi:nucleoside-diphosphate-sugar epimerase